MAIFIRGAMSINAKIISPSSFPASPMDWVKQFGFYANYEARPWIHDLKICPRRAALIVPVDANKKALIVLEEIPQSQANASFVPRRPTTGLIPESELIALSADTVRDLLRQVEKILSLMKGQSCRLDHLASFLSREFDCQKKKSSCAGVPIQERPCHDA